MGDMDSVNSGSIHSSSTADDQEFDSRAAVNCGSLPTFFHNTVPFHHHHHHHHQVSSFNNTTNTFHLPSFSPSFPNNNTNINDLGMVWAEKYNSIIEPVDDPENCTSTGFNPTLKPTPLPVQRVSTESTPGSSDNPGPGGSGRNPKKRSRASRRAPTTVLTTDTNNFRQMVQEFTGIPVSPFSGCTRLDLLGGLGIQLTPPQQQQPPLPHILRPFPQKIFPSMTRRDVIGVVGPNATRSSSMNEFALGQTTTTTTTTTTATCVNTCSGSSKCSAIDSGNVIMSALNTDRVIPPLQRRVDACEDDVGGEFIGTNNSNGVNAGNFLEKTNHGNVNGVGGGGRSSEGMMDSWICSSSDN